MLTSALVSLFIGALLSRFKAFILFPVFFLTLLIAIGAAVVRADAVLTVVATAVVTIIGLQMGYLLGAVNATRDAACSRKLTAPNFADELSGVTTCS